MVAVGIDQKLACLSASATGQDLPGEPNLDITSCSRNCDPFRPRSHGRVAQLREKKRLVPVNGIVSSNVRPDDGQQLRLKAEAALAGRTKAFQGYANGLLCGDVLDVPGQEVLEMPLRLLRRREGHFGQPAPIR